MVPGDQEPHILFILRQRAPFAGLFLAGSLGILVSDSKPDCWPCWIGVLIPAALIVWIAGSTWSALLVMFATLGFWHAFQIATDPGYRKSVEQPFDSTDHDVILLIRTEPQFGEIQSFQRFEAQVESIDERPADFLVAAQCSGEPFSSGDRILIHGKFQIPGAPMNPGQFNFGQYYRRQSIYLSFRSQNKGAARILNRNQGDPMVRFWRAGRNAILQRLQSGLREDRDAEQTIEGLFLGARGEINEGLKQLFRDTGTIHLFAASGLQLGFFAGLAWTILRYLPLSRRAAVLLILPIAVTYGALTENHPATLRAMTMSIMAAAGATLERPVATINSLCGSAFLVLVADTQELFQTGFQLSFVAVLAILIGAKPLGGLFYRPFCVDPFFPRRLLTHWQQAWHRTMFVICHYAGLSAVCWIATAPILILQDHRVSLVSVIANLAVVPMAMTVLFLGVASLVSGLISSQFATCFIQSAWLVVKAILAVLHLLVLLPCHCVNLSLENLFDTDSVTALDAGYEQIVHIHVGGHNWLINTGKASQWRSLTAPYLESKGVNRVDRILFENPPPNVRQVMDNVRVDFIVGEVAPPVDGGFALRRAGLSPSERWFNPGGTAAVPIDVCFSDSEPPLKGRMRSPWPELASVTVRLRKFRVTILPVVSTEFLNGIKPDRADVVYCGRLKDRKFPLDLILQKFRPAALVVKGTKPETTATLPVRGPELRCFCLRQKGAVTTRVLGETLAIRSYKGAELRLPSRTR